VDALAERQDEVVGERAPAALVAATLARNTQESLAALRGFVLLGDRAMAQQRAAAWAGVQEDLTRLGGYLGDAALVELSLALDECLAAQDRVERLAHTPGNQPARQLWSGAGAPLVERLQDGLSAMLGEEEQLEATPMRKALLGELANARGALAAGLASTNAYLVQGQAGDLIAQREAWVELTRYLLAQVPAGG
jgi:methyl-accepting chemotaxis protein